MSLELSHIHTLLTRANEAEQCLQNRDYDLAITALARILDSTRIHARKRADRLIMKGSGAVIQATDRTFTIRIYGEIEASYSRVEDVIGWLERNEPYPVEY